MLCSTRFGRLLKCILHLSGSIDSAFVCFRKIISQRYRISFALSFSHVLSHSVMWCDTQMCACVCVFPFYALVFYHCFALSLPFALIRVFAHFITIIRLIRSLSVFFFFRFFQVYMCAVCARSHSCTAQFQCKYLNGKSKWRDEKKIQMKK